MLPDLHDASLKGAPQVIDPFWAFYKQTDHMRRWEGFFLDILGAGPGETPYRVLLRSAGVTLRAYEAGYKAGPVLLIVPAPIKRVTIWDLAPWASVVRQCMRSGVRVFLIEWEEQGRTEGLADYADRFILQCLNAVEGETGERRTFLAGHSLGGTLAAIFASLHTECLQGIILLGSPINLGKDAGDLAPLVLSSPRAPFLTARWADVPGSFLSVTSSLASPRSFLWDRWMDWLGSLPDAQARETHLRAVRWMFDEMPMPRGLFQETVELLYRENRFMSGRLEIRGRRAVPEGVEAPILSVIDPRCRVVPPESMLPFHEAVRSIDRRVLWYEGDVGVAVQHLGMLIGKRAHRAVWPEIIRWMHDRYRGA